MALRVWLHEGHDVVSGVEALGLDWLGFSTWGSSEAAVLEKLPARFMEYCAWRARNALPVSIEGRDVEVVGRFVGDEILFPPDSESARVEEIGLAIRLLDCSRADLVAEFEAAPVRANLAHVANSETHYYTRNIGHTPLQPPADPGGD